MRIKILYLIDKLVTAGTQTNLLELVRGLDRNSFEPHVIALLGGGELEKTFESLGVKPVILKTGALYSPSALKTLDFLTQYMRREKIQLVQTHFLHADVLGLLAARRAGIKTVIWTRRDEGFWHTNAQKIFGFWLKHWPTAVLANSEAVKKACITREHIPEDRIQVIYNGIHENRFSPFPELRTESRNMLAVSKETVVVGVIGNMRHEIKGHRYLIDAVPLIKRECPNVKFVLAGDGPLKKELQEQALSLGVSDAVIFTGVRKDTGRLLNGFDLFCLPSLSEGFSNAILEAMAAEKAVVACRTGGNPEAVEDGKTGILVEPANSSFLARALMTLIQNRNLRERMGKEGRLRMLSRFQAGQMVRNYESYYRTLLGLAEPRRILHLIWSLDLGGAEQVVIQLVKGLKQKGFEPMVGCLNHKGRFSNQVEASGVRVVEFKKLPKFDPLLISKLARFIKEEKIDLIHTHLFTAHLWGRIAGALTGVPVVSTEHGMDSWRGFFHILADRILCHVNEKVIFVSEKARDFYAKQVYAMNGKAEVIHNGIETKRFEQKTLRDEVRRELNIPKNEIVLGAVGRLVPEKAFHDFLKAVSLVSQKNPNVTALLIGEGPLVASLHEEVKKLKLESFVRFLGFREDSPRLYQAMDIFVLSSVSEGLPITMLEAMAAGVPIVGTQVGGIGECIRDGQDGLLVSPGKPEELAWSILKLIEQKDLREKISRSAKDRVNSDFSLERMVERYQGLYEEVLKKS